MVVVNFNPCYEFAEVKALEKTVNIMANSNNKSNCKFDNCSSTNSWLNIETSLRRVTKANVTWTRFRWFCISIFWLTLGIAIGIISNHCYVILFNDTLNKCIDHTDVFDEVIHELNSTNIHENLKILTSKPHLAGSVQDEEHLVGFIKERWESYLDEVEVFPYDVLLSFPNETDMNYVAVIHPNGSETRKSNPVEMPVTKDEENAKVVSAYNAYAPAGHVEGKLFYVNYRR